MREQNIQHLLWEKVESSNTKIAKKVYNILNNDVLEILAFEDTKRYYYQKTYSGAYIPKYVYTYADKLLKKLGYTYLYN